MTKNCRIFRKNIPNALEKFNPQHQNIDFAPLKSMRFATFLRLKIRDTIFQSMKALGDQARFHRDRRSDEKNAARLCFNAINNRLINDLGFFGV